MEVRCGHCNKLFRVADDKITGTGIRFKCSKCGESVTITSEDFQRYKLSQETVSVLDTFAPKPPKAPAAAPAEPKSVPKQPSAAEGFAGFDIIEDHETAAERELPKEEPAPFLAAPHEFGEEALAGAPPLATPEVKPPTKPVAAPPLPQPKPQQPQHKPTTQPKPAPKVEVVPPQVAPETPGAGPAISPPPVTERPAPAVRPSAAPSIGAPDTVHPIVSGSAVGAAGGIGCAVPTVAMTILGVGMLSALFKGKGGDLPVFQAAFMAGASLTGAGIVIGVVLAMIQAKSDRNMFGVLGALLGAFLGAVFGAAQGVIVAAGSGAIIGGAFVIGSAIGWGFKALLVSIVVVIIRRTIMSSKREEFGTSLSGGQMMGVVLAGLMVVLGVYSEVVSASKMKTAKDEATKAVQEAFTPEGLQVTSSLASWDQTNGDLILNVTVENTTDQEKPGGYIVAVVYDANGGELIQVKMLNGKQMFTQRDYGIMTKRNVNVQEFKAKQFQEKPVAVPPHGLVNVEMRVMEPPAGVASFVASFQPFDPMKMIKEQMEEAAKQQQQQQPQR